MDKTYDFEQTLELSDIGATTSGYERGTRQIANNLES